jgi:hypothetical protein
MRRDAERRCSVARVSSRSEGGYNSSVTCACTEAVVRTLLGEPAPPPPPRRLASCTAPTLRAVAKVHEPFWPVLRAHAAAFDAYFSEAARVGEPERASKRRRKSATEGGGGSGT